MTNNPKGQRNKRTGGPKYPPNYPRMSTLHPRDEAVKSAQDASIFVEDYLLKHPNVLKNEMNDEKLMHIRKSISSIAHSYWDNLHFFEREKPSRLRSETKALRKSATTLLERCTEYPQDFRVELRDEFTSKSDFRDRPTSFDAVVYHLESLVKACNFIIAKPVQRGAPRNVHIAEAVEDCATLWTEITGERFSKTIDAAREMKDRNTGVQKLGFTSPSPQFVWEIISRIDPAVSFEQVRSAISKMKPNQTKK